MTTCFYIVLTCQNKLRNLHPFYKLYKIQLIFLSQFKLNDLNIQVDWT